jgi:hypothetical protein
VVGHQWRNAVEADGIGWGSGTARRGPRQRPAPGARELEAAGGGVGGDAGGCWWRRGDASEGEWCDGSGRMDMDPIGAVGAWEEIMKIGEEG